MADETPFRGAIQFLEKIGVYEVVLPFLLIFTIIFAILEKSKIFGTETIDNIEYTKKNLNSMFAFVTAFLAVASTRLVAAINEAAANITILLLLAVCFLLLVGTFHSGKEEFDLLSQYKAIFYVIMFVSILLIFLHAIKTEDGTPWLTFVWDYIVNNISSAAFGALILTLVLIGLMSWITSSPSKEKSFLGFKTGKKEDEEK
ncbi:hypothetical protein JW930_00210 [Candidatus Woesearchaeota archaeon]|nr:hypothetical protein [Candidatus Woesearchaeota archaeon]